MAYPTTLSGDTTTDQYVQPYFESSDGTYVVSDIVLYQEGVFEYTIESGENVVRIEPFQRGDFKVVTLAAGSAVVGVKLTYYDYQTKSTKVLQSGFNINVQEPTLEP